MSDLGLYMLVFAFFCKQNHIAQSILDNSNAVLKCVNKAMYKNDTSHEKKCSVEVTLSFCLINVYDCRRKGGKKF